MDQKEFDAKTKRTEDASTITFDIRGHGNKQGEAADWYLHGRLWHFQNTGIGIGQRTVVVLCDSAAKMPSDVDNWLRHLNAGGAPTELRRA